ncbi:MAG: DUF1553 domain-containing protein [Verrucomicrobiae bacterium]|nr:DUF1553 domain-containing protein [Verrucomicrobiae bacterium]
MFPRVFLIALLPLLLGAADSHWAFQPPMSPDVPGQSAAHGNPIDRFIARKLAQAGLRPAPPAPPHTLLRRVHLDLLGLPPEPDEISLFIDDASSWSRVVDRLLANPRYGERWAQHWLDVVRYADTHGFEVNTPRENAWPYRDYVIRAFNEDRPYDRFIREQLAGDTCGEDAATGFLVAAAVLLPGQIGKDEASKRLARQDSLDEMIVSTGESFLGLTIGCARCHDHKFDPITQTDYYALQAFFAGVKYGERPVSNERTRQQQAEAKVLDRQIAEIGARLGQLEPLAFTGRVDPEDVNAGRIRLRAPVSPQRNVERFPPTPVRRLRFTVESTLKNNLREPCIDELVVLAADGTDRNVALSSLGTQASASDSADSSRHKLEHINDGRFGNEHSWMSRTKGGGWVQLQFRQNEIIDRVIWARDREGRFKDRLPLSYRIEVSGEDGPWQLVAGSQDRLPYGTPTDTASAAPIENLPEAERRLARSLEKERRELVDQRKRIPDPERVYAGQFEQPGETFVLRRGDPEQPGQAVAPRVPVVLQGPVLGSDSGESRRRRALADWIASADNPLTARVMANRIWQFHFGTGLVETSSDFGRNGVRPSHPELLDWLADEFIRSGWSVKHIHRLILLSDTYRQSHRINPEARAVDADNRLLWRFPSRRLEAEAIRDSLLMVSGELNLRMGGPGFSFFKSRGGLSGFPPLPQFTANEKRRMIYQHKIRMEPVPVFGAFDCPDAGQPMPQRKESTTAIQALNLFNSPFVNDTAVAFARRVTTEAGPDPGHQITRAFQLALGRPPDPSESAAAKSAVAEHGLPTLCRVLFNSNEFLFLP